MDFQLEADMDDVPDFGVFEAVQLAEEGEWEDVVELIEQNLVEATAVDDFGMMPLHWACTEPSVPIDVLKFLLQVYPAACQEETSSGMLPLHVAIRSKLPGLHIECVLRAFPTAIIAKDRADKYPFEVAQELNLPRHTIAMLEKATYAYTQKGAYSRASSCDSNFQGPQIHSFSQEDSIALKTKLSNDVSENGVDEISGQLKSLVDQLRQLNVEMKLNSPNSARSSSSTDLSTLSGDSEGGFCLVNVQWNPENKLGLSFGPLRSGNGVLIERVHADKVGSLEVGDRLYSINDAQVLNMHFDDVTRKLKACNKTTKLCFMKQMDGGATEQPHAQSRVSFLLEETMKCVSQAEVAVRMSQAY